MESDKSIGIVIDKAKQIIIKVKKETRYVGKFFD